MKKNFFLKSKKILSCAILICIIVSLLLTGIGMYLVNDYEDYVVKIGSEKIYYKKLQQIMMDLYSNQKNFNSNLEPSQEEITNLKKEALLKIINHTLLKQYAKSIQIIIPDEEIKNTIQSITAFHSEEKFDLEKLKTTLHNSGLTLKEFIHEIYDHLLVEKLIKNINLTSFLLPYEIEQILSHTLQERHIRTIRYSKKLIDEYTVSEEDIYAEYKLNEKKYELPEKFNIDYILINLEKISNNLVINPIEIKEWYKKNIHLFTIPEKKRYSVIQTDSYEEAQNHLKKIESGEDFYQIARKESKDIFSSIKSGDIGWIPEDIIIEEIRTANLKNRNEVSKIIKFSSGYLIIKLVDIKSKNIKNLESVYNMIENKIKFDKSQKILTSYKENIKNLIKQNQFNLTGLASHLSTNTKKTGLLELDSILNILSKQLNLKKINFINNENLNKCDSNLRKNQLYENEKSILIFCMKEFQPKYIQPLHEIQDVIIKEIKNKKFILQTRINLEKIITQLNTDNSLEIINKLKNIGLIVSDISKVSVFDQIHNDEFKKFIFDMPKPIKEKIVFKIFNDKDDIFLVALEKVSFKESSDLDKNILINQLKNQFFSLNLDALLTNLRYSTKIKSKILEKI
ncbi:MAG: SurA N-terminal domain-containing protein [Wigglesworthia glossinidia]|nr:SurA N-terminal domain-containing protein [Wigglesworthia glossinidia]